VEGEFVIGRILKASPLLLILGLLGTGRPAADVPAGTNATEFSESQYAVLTRTTADRNRVRPGEEFTLAVRYIPFNMGEIHFHIYGAEEPDDWSYLPTTLTMDPAEGVEWADPVFPAGEFNDGQYWMTGQPVVTITGRLSEDAEPGERMFSGNTVFSACTEDFCLAPSEVRLEWNLRVVAADYAGEIPVTPVAKLLEPVEVDYGEFTLPDVGELGGGIDLSAGDADAGEDIGAALTGGFNPDDVKTIKGTELPLWKILLFAMLGGLILNVMPCVLPVVSIKVIDLVKNVEKEPKTVINHGLIFAAGIVATFLAGALVIVAIQALGQKAGWGTQFQSPGFLIIMSAIIFLFGLSLADVFKIKAPEAVTDSGGSLAAREGYGGSFFKGVLATLLGTPCVGPFLGPALLVAFTLTWMHTVMIFFFVGLGMALPYIIMLPMVVRMGRRQRGQFSRKLQESRGWMDDFKHGMSFLMFATVIYLMYIMQGVIGGRAVIWALVFLLGLGFAAWLFARMASNRPGMVWATLSALILAVLIGWFSLPKIYAMPMGAEGPALSASVHSGWENFSLATLQEHTARGRTVLVDFTADWCPNCKTNEAVALNIDSTMQLKDELDMIFMVADWTQRDDEIGDVLRALGFASVPLTAIFPGDNPNAPILLDGVYTPTQLHEAMREAAGATQAGD
jgi:thiol:disulfide interchange protein